MAFAPGQSGNPLGSLGGWGKFRATLDRAIAQDDAKRLRQCAETLLDLAAGGDLQAIAMIADRLDGKPRQQTEVSGPDGGPVYIKTGIDRLLSEAAESAGR